jgi:hypothetical protein
MFPFLYVSTYWKYQIEIEKCLSLASQYAEIAEIAEIAAI